MRQKKKEKEKPPVTDDEEDFAEPEPALELGPDDAEEKRKADLLKTVEAMDLKLQSIEYKLVSPALVNSDDKYYVEAYRVYLNLIWLNAEVGTGGGDVAGGADFAPTRRCMLRPTNRCGQSRSIGRMVPDKRFIRHLKAQTNWMWRTSGRRQS